MHKFKIDKIKSASMKITKLEVQSFEMNVYLVKLYTHDTEGFVYDASDKPMRFHNSQQIRDAFEHCEVDEAVMIHDSPYDEMIGNPNKPEPSMAMPFSMQQPY
uniref:DUF6482 family protein n=1 Tax=Ningiella ruwaisensis TaxID=2364274 RepID=UPI00109FB17A|nr:DUF6482 family protein [Ningiella ruwaisensis]